MKTHSIFPTVIGEDFYTNNDHTKDLVVNTYFEKCDENGYSNEITGHINLHHDPRYEYLYKDISHSVLKYLVNMAIMPGVFDVNITKSWFNVTLESNTPMHNHPESHLSFVYYVNHPEDATRPLVLHNTMPTPTEPHEGFFYKNVHEWNHSNSYSWSLHPQEGTLYIFPSKLQHSTVGADVGSTGNTPNFTKEDLLKKRISLAGDVLLTYKTLSTNPTGLQPVSNWKSFT